MTPRERQASGTEIRGVSAAPRAAVGAALPRPDTAVARTPPWEELFPSASPAQQSELLAMARRQGLLYAHQLPAPANGARPPGPADDSGSRQLLPRLLAGHVEELEPVRPGPVEVYDRELDPHQREAVVRALSTPDVCLIQGLPGTGKSRVVAEVLLQAAVRGWRTLLLAPGAAALDRVLLQIGAHDAVCPLRCLAGNERAESLPPPVRALTFSERVRCLSEQSLQSARQALRVQEERRQRLQGAERVWPAIQELAHGYARLQEELDQLARQQEVCPAEVERAAAGKIDTVTCRGSDTARTNVIETAAPPVSFLASLAALSCARQDDLARVDAGLAEAERKIEERRRQLATCEPEVEALRPLARAKDQGRWWTWAWWRATWKSNVCGRFKTLERQQREARGAIGLLEETVRRLHQEKLEGEQAYRADRQRLLEAETARRRAELEARAAVLRAEQARVQAQWQRILGGMAGDIPRPAEISLAAVERAHRAWQNHLEHADQAITFGREWLDFLQEAGPNLAGRLPEYVNLVAATPSGLAADPHFGDHRPTALFDLLILEEADQVSEADFLKAARRARRWILVGEPPADGESIGLWEKEKVRVPERQPALGFSRPHAASFARAPVPLLRPSHAVRPPVFHRLWVHLHSDPRKLPYAWGREDCRLCCRLRPLAADQRQWLESERVADSPEIELRIFAPPRTPPQLAEVVFPASMSVRQAKEYIYRELEELPVQSSGHSLLWVEEPERLILHLAGGGASTNGTGVPLEPGVWEMVGPEHSENGWQTCRLEFERRAGWQRPQAEEWVRRRLGVRDLGRTFRLDAPRRMPAPLAAFLSELLFEGADGYTAANVETRAGPPAVEFVAVPSLVAEGSASKPANGRRGGSLPRRAPTSRGGAGLEVNLAGPRHADGLPADLRALLPDRGFVNYREAQAVVRQLEALADELRPERRDMAATSCRPALPGIAVLALYPGQGELIRCLIRQSPKLSRAGLKIEVDVPGAFRHREADVVLVSLTRSHSHRAVSFGDGPQALSLALTRARQKLILFGDAGTLARRSQWEGPLDHLDGPTAGRERKFVAHLLGYLQGQGRYPEVFHVREGNSP